ncbi:unnamed protein product [Pseudo-nitzschia multistriata]|uniref:Uncharacterized protein n=1 Tax=Pseudo-nitzschia multistriata TaxID=183589 RepID=A0A448ZIH7_9STRA|nr:unnamed protein product [Pseudo-nitzschia multistriata]
MDRSAQSFADFMRSNDPENNKGIAKKRGSIGDGDSEEDSFGNSGDLIGSSFPPDTQRHQQEQHLQQHRSGRSGVEAAVALAPPPAPRRRTGDSTSHSHSNSHSHSDSNTNSSSSHLTGPHHSLDSFHQNAPVAVAAAVFATNSTVGSNHPSYGSTSEFPLDHGGGNSNSRNRNGHNYAPRHNLRHHHHQQSERKQPPPSQYDARPNLKDDLSYSYQQQSFDEDETDRNRPGLNARHQAKERQHEEAQPEHPSPYQHYSLPASGGDRSDEIYGTYRGGGGGPANTSRAHGGADGVDALDRKLPGTPSRDGSRHRRASPGHESNRSGGSSGARSSGNGNVNGNPRPLPRPGKPPGPTARPVLPKSFAPRLGHRSLLLSSSSSQQPQASLGLEQRVMASTIQVECVGCTYLIKNIPRNAIALECPQCRRFFPTVTCRVVQ